MTSTVIESGLLDELERQTRRSRLSFHFNTKKRRRWLLVQLVSMPVSEALEREHARTREEADDQPLLRNNRSESWPDTYSRLLDNYTNTMHMTRPR